jgi:RHS repeat-associated protein
MEGMSARFVNIDHDTPVLLPPDLRDWPPAGHMVHFSKDAVAALDLSRAHTNQRGTLTTDAPPAGSAVTIWQYSATTGRLERKQYADNNGTDYTYTNAGRLLTRVWARGITTTYGYTHGLLTSTNYCDSTPDVAITYDSLGRQQSVSNGLANSTFDYDDATDLGIDTETITYTLPDQSPFERVLDRRARSYGRDTGWQLKNGGNVENEALYTWSATTGRLETVANAADTFSYDYEDDSYGLLATITKEASGGNPAHTVTNTWELTRDVLDIKTNKVAGATVSGFDYFVNELGQRESVATTGSEFPSLPGWTWGYDSLGQVISADHSTNNTSDRGYTYDAIGNRRGIRNGAVGVPLESDGSIKTGQGTLEYAANSLNQYTKANGVTLPVAPTPAPHDLDGNLRFDGGVNKDNEAREYLWDAENRLIAVKRVSDSATVVSFLYDAQSRRIAKIAGNTTTLYFYDGFNCIAEYSITGTASPVLAKTRTWGIDLSGSLQGAGGVGGLLAEKQGTSTFYPTFDGNGNISEYLAPDGTVAAHFEYDPFGNIVEDSYSTGFNATSFTYKFSTKPLDAETGLYYYQYRYYDPVTGRWPSRDLIGERGGVNLYGFVGNDGVGRVDTFGLTGVITVVCTKWQYEGTDNGLSPDVHEEKTYGAWRQISAPFTSWDQTGDVSAVTYWTEARTVTVWLVQVQIDTVRYMRFCSKFCDGKRMDDGQWEHKSEKVDRTHRQIVRTFNEVMPRSSTSYPLVGPAGPQF